MQLNISKNSQLSLSVLIGALITNSVAAQDKSSDQQESLEPVVVSATRSETPASQLTRSVTVISEREIQQQASLDQDLGSILAQTVPGMAPSTEGLSNFGQNLRGRNFLVLIDGVPTSMPLRDSFRDLNTINPAAIERIEVVRGGTAAYGFGAAGGLVNVITKKAAKEKMKGYSEASISFSTEHFDDSGEYQTKHRVSGTRGNFDYVAAGSFTSNNGRFDSEGRRIPPDPFFQGGLSDSDEYNILGKLGYDFDDGKQRLDVMLNHYNLEQETDFVAGFLFGNDPTLTNFSTLNNDPLPNSRRTPAIPRSAANPGSTNLVNPGTENTIANINYNNNDFFGSSIKVNSYYSDHSGVFSKFPGSPQSDISSEKYGGRLTIDTPFDLYKQKASLIWGMDYLYDDTSQFTFGQNATDALNLEQDAVAGFAEVEIPVGSIGLVRGGVRHEEISVDVDSLTPNASRATVMAGTLEYSETLFNASGVLFLTDSLEMFASFSQGLSLSDVGRVIDDARGGPFRAEDFESDAEKVDTYEVGLRSNPGPLSYSLAAFYSKSDNGTTFGPPPQILIVKNEEEIYGLEGSIDYTFNRSWQAGGTFSWAEGTATERTRGEYDLPNTRIAPEKITTHLEYQPRSWWQNRLQLQYVGSRNPDTPSSVFGGGEIDSYMLVDFMTQAKLGMGKLRLTVENLLNKDYFPAANQAYNSTFAFSKGPGRRVGVAYSVNW